MNRQPLTASRPQSGTMNGIEVPDLTSLFDAALPEDAPGAWIRAAIEQMIADGEAEVAR